MRTAHDAGGDRGTAVVEFALVLPLILMVALALVQVGLLARDRLLVESAARAGARVAAVEADEGAVRRAAAGAAPGLRSERMSVSVVRGGTRGDPVTVTVGYQDAIVVPFVGWLFPRGSVAMRTSTTARQEFG
jgi:Flp pilus assembly protein TadG